MSREQVYLAAGVFGWPFLLILLHWGRRRLTLGPFFGLAGVLSMMLWQTLQTGWWVAGGLINFNAALVMFVPPLIMGLLLVYVLDGLYASRAYLAMVLLTSLSAWGFSVFRETLAHEVPLPYLIVLSNREHLAIIAGLLLAQIGGMVSYALTQSRCGIWALPLSAALAVGLWLGIYSFLHFGLEVGFANISIGWRPFALAGLPTLVMSIVYALVARSQQLIIPTRSASDVLAFWRKAHDDTEAGDPTTNRGQVVPELQRLNRQSEENSRLLETHLDHASYGIVITDERQRILRANSPARLLLAPAVAIKDMVGTNLMEVLGHLLGQTISIEDIARSDSKENRWGYALAGKKRWLSIMATALPQESGYAMARGHYVILTNVTQQVRDEERHLLSSRLRDIHQTGRVLAHDFSNLLLGAQAQLLRLQDLTVDLPSAREATQGIGQALDHAKHLLEQLGSGSQFGAPRLAIHDLHSLADTALAICRASAEESGVAVDLPPPGSWPVEVDEAQIVRVLVNLIRNAIRASSAGDAIRLEIERQGLGVVVRIIDRGVGMNDEALRMAFDPGFSSKGDGKGGLGLAISYLMIEAHGGSLDLARNADGIGLCAAIWLPARSATASLPADYAGQAVIVACRSERQRERLVAECENTMHSLVAEADSWEEIDALLADEPEVWQVILIDDILAAERPGFSVPGKRVFVSGEM